LQQLTLFDVYETNHATETKQSIYERLKHYGVDDYYRKHIKGKQMLLREIHENLNNLPNYNDYIAILIDELKQVVPVIPYLESFERKENCLILVSEYPRIYTHHDGKDGLIGSNSLLFCLAAIPDDFFRKE